MAKIAKPAKYGQNTGAGIENTTSISAGAGIWASVAQKVVIHNSHLQRDFYNQYDQGLTTSELFSKLIRCSATGAGAASASVALQES